MIYIRGEEFEVISCSRGFSFCANIWFCCFALLIHNHNLSPREGEQMICSVVRVVRTFLSWVDGGHWAERAFSFVVVNPDFDLVRGKGRNAFILEDVSGGIRRSDSSLHPALWPKWAESYHIAKARTTLQLLGNRLRRYEMTQRDDSRWLIIKILIPKDMKLCTD